MPETTFPFPPASVVWPWIKANCSEDPIVTWDEEEDFVERIEFMNAEDQAAFEAFAARIASPKAADVVRVSGGDFPLSSYPEAQLQFFDFSGMSDEERVDVLEEMDDSPATALDIMAREYTNALVLRHGRGEDCILPCRVIGRAEATLWAGGSTQGGDYYFRASGVDTDFEQRTDWLSDHATGLYAITWRRDDTGDGILLDDYVYFVAFHDPADDAAFVAAFPEAAR